MNTIPISLPYVYEVRGRRGKVGRVIHRSGIVEEHVRSVLAAEAPITGEWEDGGSRNRIRHAIRSFEGGHYVATPGPLRTAAFTREHKLSCSAFDHAMIARLLRLEPLREETKVLGELLSGRVPTSGNYGKDIDRVVTSDETFRRNDAISLARSLLFIDGVAWTRCREPKLRVSYENEGPACSMSVVTLYDNRMHRPGYGYFSTKKGETDIFFSLAEFAKACDFLEGTGRSVVAGGVSNVVIHDDDAFSFDGHRSRLLKLSEDLSFILRTKVGSMDVETVQEWMAIRDFGNDGADTDLSALLNLIERLMPEAADHPDYGKISEFLAITRFLVDDRSDRVRMARTALNP